MIHCYVTAPFLNFVGLPLYSTAVFVECVKLKKEWKCQGDGYICYLFPFEVDILYSTESISSSHYKPCEERGEQIV
jgi:hypothetical protein